MTKPAQMINPRDAGLRGLDLKQPLFDEDAIARADEALASMGEEMADWLTADVERLQVARLDAEQASWSFASLEALMTVAHDIKGMGATYGSSLATKIGASLCRLIETDDGKAIAQSDPALVRAHVDALRAAVRDGINSETHPIGRAVLQALEARVAALGVAPR